MARHGIFDATRVQLPYWRFISGICLNAPNNYAVPYPSDATIIEIDAETAACYYEINGASAGTTSSGYVPTGGGRIIGPLSNLVSLRVHAPGAVVHIMFFQEV